VSDQEFIGETEARSRGFYVGDSHGKFVVGEDLIVRIEVKGGEEDKSSSPCEDFTCE
jgi:hypothetical protein